jgi:hypothetical protein
VRTVLDRYAVITPIGSGGMGSLWAASDQRVNRKVAVKLIRRFEVSATHRSYREARIAAVAKTASNQRPQPAPAN